MLIVFYLLKKCQLLNWHTSIKIDTIWVIKFIIIDYYQHGDEIINFKVMFKIFVVDDFKTFILYEYIENIFIDQKVNGNNWFCVQQIVYILYFLFMQNLFSLKLIINFILNFINIF